MNVKEIIDLIDEDKLQELGNIHKIDKINNKITGKFILKSFISCILKGYNMSLRSLELLCNGNKDIASLLNAKNICNKRIDHSSIGKRLATLEINYFKDIYEDLIIKYGCLSLVKRKKINSIDLILQ